MPEIRLTTRTRLHSATLVQKVGFFACYVESAKEEES